MAGICDLIFGKDREIVYWVQKQLGMKDLEVPASGMGFAKDGELIGGAIYFNFREDDVEMGVATISPHWASRRSLKAMFGYPFDLLGADRITVYIKQDNAKSRDRAERLGFVREGMKRPDVIMYGMLKSECKWL